MLCVFPLYLSVSVCAWCVHVLLCFVCVGMMLYGLLGCLHCVCLCVLCLMCVLLVMYDVMLCGSCVCLP